MSSKDFTKFTDDFNQLNFVNCQKLANMNDPDGMYWLGYCYEHGIEIEKDANKAFTHYQKSADMNNSNGMYQVGYCYYLGIGVAIDKHKAFTYYLKSAVAGNLMGIWKTAVCYLYGIGVEENENKFWEWIEKDPTFHYSSFDSHSSYFDFDDYAYGSRKPGYGKCSHCNEDNTNKSWCLSCDPDIETKWTIKNKDIDDCMKMFQLRAIAYEDTIEWIPFDRLSDVKEIGKGGFGSVHSAIWLDGIRKVDEIKVNDDDSYSYKRSRELNSIVALKTLAISTENNIDFLKEFKSLMQCKLNANKLAIYGITQNTETKEYLMVFQYANSGSLHQYLRKNFSELTWQTKLQILKSILDELDNIHRFAGYIHADFHSGNILQDQHSNGTIHSYIADLGLSRKKDEYASEGNIYGVMPYVAPEVLLGGQQFSQEADIYGFGIIMTEMSTGQRPFDGRKFDLNLAIEICNGLRPEFAFGTPKCYIELAEKCTNSDPQERPRALDIYHTIRAWLNQIANTKDNEIKKQFLDADKALKSLPKSKHPDEIYSSKIIRTKLISKAINDSFQRDTTQINLEIVEF